MLSRRLQIEAIESRPTPIGFHRVADYGAVLFLLKRNDGSWQDELVSATEVESDGGFSWNPLGYAGVAWPEPSALWAANEFHALHRSRIEVEVGSDLVAIAGYCPTSVVVATLNGLETARADVPAHGMFVLTTIANSEDDVTVSHV